MIKERIKNKNVLFIPVVSMRSYETGKYRLNCDGNIARLLSLIYGSSISHAYITVPYNVDVEDFDALTNKLENKGLKGKITFLKNYGYGENASATRKSNRIVNDVALQYNLDDFDLIVAEPQQTICDLIAYSIEVKHKTIYWCVASKTRNYSPWFVEEYADIDKFIASEICTACATLSQVIYLGGYAYKDEFYNANFSDINIIFFPFRLSDKSYKFKKLLMMIEHLCSSGHNNFKVLITDPNDSFSGFLEDCASEVLKHITVVPSIFELYIAILKGKPIIPYFENANEVKHIAIDEMQHYGCKIICYKNSELEKNENTIMVNNDIEFYNALKRLVSGGTQDYD